MTSQYEQSLAKIFNDFANQEVQVIETPNQGSFRRLQVASSDTVTAELRKEIEGMGLGLHLLIHGNQMPGHTAGGTVPVFVKKDADNKYRIDQVGIGALALKR